MNIGLIGLGQMGSGMVATASTGRRSATLPRWMQALRLDALVANSPVAIRFAAVEAPHIAHEKLTQC